MTIPVEPSIINNLHCTCDPALYHTNMGENAGCKESFLKSNVAHLHRRRQLRSKYFIL